MSGRGRVHAPHPTAVLRGDDARVTPLELFFDLVFVLTLTQCTALMAERTTWTGVGQAMLVLALIWWAWSGYAWLTSVVDPEQTIVRIVMFTAMAAFLVDALCVEQAFDDLGLLFACAYAVVRIAHIALFAIASRDEPGLRRSVICAGDQHGARVRAPRSARRSPTAGCRPGSGSSTIALDFGGPYFFGVEGWKLVPGHFVERFGLIIIIALGESIVAIGAGIEKTEVDAGIVTAAVLGVAVVGALWWLYFDVVARVAERRLENAEVGREQNATARDSFSYIHLPMVAGIVLLALGLKKTLGHTEEHLKLVPAFAMFGGTAIYLLAPRRVPLAQRAPLLDPAARRRDPPPRPASRSPRRSRRSPRWRSCWRVLAVLIVYETFAFTELRAKLDREVEAAPAAD